MKRNDSVEAVVFMWQAQHKRKTRPANQTLICTVTYDISMAAETSKPETG
jgi:hypothetical protein